MLGRRGSVSINLEFEPRMHGSVLLQSQHWGSRARVSWYSADRQPNLVCEFQANDTPCLKAQGAWYPETLDLHNTQTQMDQKMESGNTLPHLDEEAGKSDLSGGCDSARVLTWLGDTSMGIFCTIHVTDSASGGVVREPG